MKSYFRFLSRNKLYTAINVIGLAISLMFVILLGDFSWRQMSIDNWSNANRITMIGNNDNFFFWPQAVQEVQDMCPEVESTCRLLSHAGKLKSEKEVVVEKGKPIILITDQTFFDFFDFKLKLGDRNTALDAPDKCVITESLAKQLFPGEVALGKTLQIKGVQQIAFDNKEWLDSTLVYNVAGIIEELDRTVLPSETKIIINMERYPQVTGYAIPNDAHGMGSFGESKALFMVKPGMDLNAKKEIISKHILDNYVPGWASSVSEINFIPLRELMFAPQNAGRGLLKGEKGKWQILLAVILAVLFFAVSNYINLTVANSTFRAKEMGTRRLLGSSRENISMRLMVESVLMVVVTFLLGLILAFAFQKDFADLFNGIIALDKDINAGFICISVVFILAMSFISGFIPSLQIANVNPLDIVKGKMTLQSKTILSKLFITIQSVITVVMLVAVLIIRLQFHHLVNAPLGFNHENIYQLFVYGDNVKKTESLLAAIPGVLSYGHMGGSGLTNGNSATFSIYKEDYKVTFRIFQLDRKAFELLGFQLVKDYGQSDMGYYLNEESLRQLRLPEDAKEFDRGRDRITPLSGVIRDFHLYNILGNVEPVMIQLYDQPTNDAILVKTDGTKETLEQIKKALIEIGVKEGYLDSTISDINQEIIDSFGEVRNTLDIVLLFTGIAIVISVMGFVGMSLFFIRQNHKQIGLRRIMGSSIREVFLHMLRNFCIPIFISFFIGVPLAYYIMDNWLNGFSYRIAQSPWVFVVSCFTTLGIALASVSIQIYRASTVNPIESIKTE